MERISKLVKKFRRQQTKTFLKNLHIKKQQQQRYIAFKEVKIYEEQPIAKHSTESIEF